MRPKTKATLGALLVLWMSTACLTEPFTGSVIQIDFFSDLDPSGLVRMPDGSDSHYELWAQFGDEGVVSLGTFIVTTEFHVNGYPEVDRRLGTVFNPSIDIQSSGVRFNHEASLERAGSMFLTIEPNGETDISPSGVVVLEGPLAYDGEGLLRGVLTGEYTNVLGEQRLPQAAVAVILALDLARL